MHAACGMFVHVSSRSPQKRQNCCYKTCKLEVPDTTWCSWLQLDILLVPFFKGERVLHGVRMDPTNLGILPGLQY